ncbi:three-Cys-motif partner protein TcmP [Litoribacter populi]|uniref:three-Cys-motif partner protein TcmP n=1 Tax=Litoribacter populi TaxID=2598460 RepID=UPI00117C245C|nr:three-Cys-motif partner protein TcmP [Litoribacter populi]
MAIKDLHDEPFDDSTIAKLEIFEAYAEAWLPTFIMLGSSDICVFDFFAGTGFDKNGVAGSPIRLLEKIQGQKENILKKNVKVHLYLNEFEPNKRKQLKFEQLKAACKAFLEKDDELASHVEMVYCNEDFQELFPKLLPVIQKNPSLVYLDQNGIKFLSPKYFLEFEKTNRTDFLYFVSSSYFWRFGEREEFKMHLDIDIALAKSQGYKFIHRSITQQLRKKLHPDSGLMLYPFSIKKGANIHGIIFGATHPRAVDKFLKIAWQKNKINGDANFDIDDEVGNQQLDFFSPARLSKIDSFKKKVREAVLSGQISNNFQLLSFCYRLGHIGTHGAECLKEMKKNGEVAYDAQSPMVTYDSVYHKTKKQLVDYQVKKK